MPDLSQLSICFIAGTLGQGGAERQLFYLIKALLQKGATVRLLCLTRDEFWEKRIRAQGVPISCVGDNASRIVRLARIINALRVQPADILQSQHFYTNLYAVAAARVLGMREVGAMRSDGVSEVKATGSVFGRLSLRAPRMIAANSRIAIHNATAMGVPSAHLRLLPNVVDTDQFKPAGRRPRDSVHLIAVGRLGVEKRFDRFISVLALLRRRSSLPITASIVGDGPERQQLERQAIELGLLPDALEFKGAVEDMAPLYQQADVLVLTSDWEGTPNVVLEAMASGLPVVATRVGDLSDLVQDGITGILTNAGDEHALTESLLRLTGNSNLRDEMGRRAREYVEDNHSPQNLPSLLSDIYKVALS